MAALCNRRGHYIFALWFLLSSIFFQCFDTVGWAAGRASGT